MEIIGLVVAFIGGVLVDHFLFNKLAGLVAPEVAVAQTAVTDAKAAWDGLASRVAALETKVAGVVAVTLPPKIVTPVPLAPIAPVTKPGA
jgi:hypothetical protein